ncbi:MAG: arylsulfatase [Flavobacteriaceae bacterium]|nr:arylsulfatase [Flavobacteriaceae bacterium]MCY4254227.1 arylsulfatase [Flavobacteriaceae bacterium]
MLVILIIQSCQFSDSLNEQPPNIIYILADDLGIGDLGIYGQKIIKTPHLDQLAQSGLRFLNHYSGSTVCAPARSVLMTGQHAGKTPIRGNKEVWPEGQMSLPDESFTVAEILQENGYITGAFGKWGLGFVGTEGDPTHQGFDTFFGYNCQREAHRYYPEHLWDNQDRYPIKDNRINQTVYAPDLIHARALDFIKQHQDKPFFLYYPSVIPHAELMIPENSFFETYRGKFEETPWINSAIGANYGDGDFNVAHYATQIQPKATMAAMISYLDNQVGQIIELVDQLGLSKNTIIMFTSDNGPHQEGGADPDFFDSNGINRGYKRDLYEGGIKVPFLVSWQGVIPKNTVSNHISSFADFLPTITDLLDIDNPENIDGISFLPTLEGNTQIKHEYLYWEFHELGGRQAVRYGKWKGIKLNVKNPDITQFELYDLENDPQETVNISQHELEVTSRINQIMDSEHISSDLFSLLQKD